jgi:hypothetical protein
MPTNRTSIALYRWTLREFQKLPANCRDYYLKLARSVSVAYERDLYLGPWESLLLVASTLWGTPRSRMSCKSSSYKEMGLNG